MPNGIQGSGNFSNRINNTVDDRRSSARNLDAGNGLDDRVRESPLG